jgi:hypothetical protein
VVGLAKCARSYGTRHGALASYAGRRSLIGYGWTASARAKDCFVHHRRLIFSGRRYTSTIAGKIR